METMAKAGASSTGITVRNAKTGRFVTVRGAGVLKGKLHLNNGMDLTKLIASQALKQAKARKTTAPANQ